MSAIRRHWRRVSIARQLLLRRSRSSNSMATFCSHIDQIGDLTTLGLQSTSTSSGSNKKVLIVGDGNFSFARAFMRQNAEAIHAGSIAVTATSLDSHGNLLVMYPNARAILEELHTGGVSIVHNVNATKLETYSFTQLSHHDKDKVETSDTFDRIVFNFPHFAEGGNRHNKINRHRQLLREFFQSARQVLTIKGQIWVTLCAGQGGTPLDRHKQRAWGDHWQIVQAAASAGLILLSAHECPVEKLSTLGYNSVGYQLREQPFWTLESVSHVFCRDSIGLQAQFSIEWTRDVSFWINDQFAEEKLLSLLREQFPAPMTLTMRRIDQYVCQRSGRTSVTYRLTMTCDRTAFSKEMVNKKTLNALSAIEASVFGSSRAH